MNEVTQETIDQAIAGDMRSFEEIYKTFSRMVYNLALKMLRNVEDAEEVTQEVFLLIHRKLHTFRGESSLKTWIYRMTVNNTLNFIKKRKRIKSNEMNYETLPEWNHHDQSTRKDIEFNEDKNMINTFLEKLNPEQRTCIVLRTVEGLSYQEIAETLNLNLNTVRTRIKRARESLLAMKKEVIKHEMG